MTGERRFEWGGLSSGRSDFVTAAEALAEIEGMVDAYTDLSPVTGLRDGEASVRLSSGERWAIVSTPGTRWFSLRVESGHRTRLVDATSTRDEAAMLLRTYLAAGAAHVRGASEVTGDKIRVEALGRVLVLTLPWTARLRRARP